MLVPLLLLASIYLLSASHTQQPRHLGPAAVCKLVLQGPGKQQQGLLAAELNCSSSSSSSAVIVALDNTVVPSQFSSRFSGVQVVSTDACYAASMPAAAAAAAAAARSHGSFSSAALLRFCSGNIVLQQLVIQDVWHMQQRNASEQAPAAAPVPAAVLAFGGQVQVAISGGSIADSAAKPLLLLERHATLQLLNGTVLIGNTGGELCNRELSIYNTPMGKLPPIVYG
jgi:hypothetical protein